jgi:hypothetical protein
MPDVMFSAAGLLKTFRGSRTPFRAAEKVFSFSPEWCSESVRNPLHLRPDSPAMNALKLKVGQEVIIQLESFFDTYNTPVCSQNPITHFKSTP